MNLPIHHTINSRPIRSTMRNTRLTLRLNALSCIVFGAMFVLFAAQLGDFLGTVPTSWLQFIGAGLLIHAAHLITASMRKTLRRFEIYYFTAGDFLWLVGSVIIILPGAGLVTTFHGICATLVVGVLVFALGLAQIWTLSKANHNATACNAG